MSALVQTNQPSHWYYPSGESCYEVPMASKKGQMRPTTLADAKKMGLLPSVTTIMRLLDKPALTSWRIEQAVLASLTLPAIAGESMDDRARRIIRDADDQVEKAATVGHLCHAAIEQYVLHGVTVVDPTIAPLLQPFTEWWKFNCVKLHYCERVVVHPGFGYAGRLDCKAEIRDRGICVIDFKTRKPSGGSLRTYPEDGLQLSAYREADAMNAPLADSCLSILINSQEPGLHIHEWPKDEIVRQFKCFGKLTELWQMVKNYNPNP